MRDPSSAANLLQKLDGVIMSRGFVVEDNLRLLSDFDGQIVLIQHQEPSPYPFHQVIHDYRPGMRVALRDLRQKGVRKLAVAGANFYTSFFRRDRLLEVAAEEGFGKSDIKVFSEDLMVGDFGRMIGGKIGKSYLSEYAEAGEYPAIFSLSDFISFGIYDELLCAGLEPGKDVLLASYDDLETGGMLPFGKPVISSVVHPFREISIEAVKVLLESMEADDGIRKIHIVPATGYIKRKSTEG
jgi:DNA-binding LacI/PurR family transcriptional regulator